MPANNTICLWYGGGAEEAARFCADTSEGVRVRVTFKSESMHTIEQQREGWQAILDNFARHVIGAGESRRAG